MVTFRNPRDSLGICTLAKRTARVVDNEEQQPPEPQLFDAVVVESIPKIIRPGAAALLNRLKTRPDVITWDKTGVVKMEGGNHFVFKHFGS